MAVDPDRPSSWLRYRSGMCDGCRAECCSLPVEATAADLVRMGLAHPDQIQGSLKKLARTLEKAGIVRYFRMNSGLFTLVQRPTGECLYLGPDRRCTIYEKRPEVCRRFPTIGPRPGFCPSRPAPASANRAAPGRGPAKGARSSKAPEAKATAVLGEFSEKK